MAKLADISKIPVPSTESGQRSIPISEAYFARIIPSWSQPSVLTPDQWRYWVKMQPIATTCKETMTSNISDLDWKITPRESDQRDELKGNIKHYERLLQRGGESGLDWVGFLEWAIEDLLDLPFGTAWEVGRKGDNPDGRVLWLEPIDGGTCYPTNNKDYPVLQYFNGYQAVFPRHAVARMYLNPRPEIERKGWGIAPPERIFLAMEMLTRGDKYYANLLLDIPPAGVFDLGDITWEDANNWIRSFRTAVTGVGSADSFKIPVLAEHTGKVEFIPLGKAPNDIMYDRITLKYASLVCAGYGMNLGDIGVQSASSSGETLAGSIRGEQKTNRTGKARVKSKLKYFIESFLPDTLRFDFIDTDGERLSMLGRARLANATAFNQLREMESISPEEARLQMIQDGLMTISMPEKPPKEAKKPLPTLGQATPFGKKAPERPGQVGAKQPPSMGGDGEVKKSIEYVSYPSEIDRVVEKIVDVIAPNIQKSLVDVEDDDYEQMKSLLLDTLFDGEDERKLSSALDVLVKSVNVGEFQINNLKMAEELRDIFASEGIYVVNMENYVDNLKERCQREFPAFLGKAIVYTLVNSELFSDDLLPSVQKSVGKSLPDFVSSFVKAELESLLANVEEETPSFITPKSVVRQVQNPITVEGAQITMPEINVSIPERSVQVEGSTFNIGQPDVNVSVEPTPIEVRNTIEVEPTPIEVKNTVQAGDVSIDVNPTPVSIENKVSVEKSDVNVSVNPTPVQINNDVTVQPAEVNIPKPVREIQKVHRDINTNIAGTTTDIEYEK